MRTASEINAEIKAKIDWGKRQNTLQGDGYDYTDTTEIAELRRELADAEAAEWADRDIVTARRAAWNADVKSGMSKGDLHDKYGYSFFGNLKAAVARLGL